MRWISYTIMVLLFCIPVQGVEIVGKINGNLGVSETGAATYSIPIDLLESNNEFFPNISLTYNSQAGNGLAGFGWGLSGLSSITIGPRNVYFDNVAEGVHEGRDNAYYLDGMRLLLVSGVNGCQGAVYRTEAERYSLITIDSVIADTPASFTVKTTDGSTYRYGSNTGRARYTDYASYEWALDYAEDRLGNYITYTYAQEGLTLYPTAISYGRNKHNNGTPLYTVNFNYGNRPDVIHVHRFETSIPFTQRLQQITCKCNGSQYKKYTMSYDTQVYSHLVSVQETGRASTSYPETTFVWENLPDYSLETSSPSVSNVTGQTFDNLSYFAADVNNNGRSELIGIHSQTGSLPGWVVTLWEKDNASGNFTQSESYFTQSGVSIGTTFQSHRQGGVIAHANYGATNSIILPCFENLYGDRAMAFYCIKEHTKITYSMRSGANGACYIISDINKDAFDDVVMVEQGLLSGTYPATIIYFDLTHTSMTYTDFSMNLAGVPRRLMTADFNADGMTDLFVCTTNGYYIYWNNAGTFSDSNRYYGTGFSECDIMELADVNADGLPDLIFNLHNSTSWYCAVNQGSSTTPFTLYPISYLENLGFSYQNGKAYCLVQDFDGDGKSDLLVGMKAEINNNFYQGQIILLKSEGGVFSYLDGHTFNNQQGFPTMQRIVQGDFDGDGVSEIMYYGNNFNTNSTDVAWRILKPGGYSASTNRITSVTDGLGVVQKISYGVLTDENVCESSVTSTFPLLTFRAALPVAKRIETIVGNDTLWTNYKYGNAVFHWQGKGFLGFRNRTATCSNGTRTVVQNAVNTNYYVLHRTSQNVYTADNALWKQGTHSTYFRAVSSKSYFAETSSDAIKDYSVVQAGWNALKSWGYSPVGTVNYEGNSDDMYTEDTYHTLWESNVPGIYIRNLPLRSESTRSGGSAPNDDTETTVEYTRDGQTGQPLSCRKYRNGTLIQTDLYTYNNCGQVTSHTLLKGNSTDALTTTYAYDVNGRLSQETNPLGQTTQYFYNGFGKLLKVIDYRGIAVMYSYDNMLRQTIYNCPPTSISRSIEAGDYGNAAYKVTETVKGKPRHITYYDALDRKVADAEQRFDGRFLYTDYTYLPNGMVGFISFPHTTNSISANGTYKTYDKFFRLTSQTDTEGRTSTWDYQSRMVVESTIDGITRRTGYSDNDGSINFIEDESGDVYYDIDNLGRYITILHGSMEATIEYDDYGHVAETTDMQGTTRSYAYDANGYPLSVTQGTSVHGTQYDKYGRLLSRTFHDNGITDTHTTYRYNNKNQLVCDSSSNHVYTYTYDTYGRLKTENRTVVADSTENMTCTYYYNSYNQLYRKKTVLASPGMTLDERYVYANGWCTSVSVNDSLVWKLDAEDNLGHTQRISNHLDSLSFAYDTYGHLLSQQVRGRHTLSQSNAYDMTTGNMTLCNSKSCTYDGLNRLIQWNGRNFTYDDEGNMLTMSQGGEMTYDGFRLTSANVNVRLGLPFQGQYDMNYLKSAERPHSIETTGNIVEFAYNGDGQRVWMKEKSKTTTTPPGGQSITDTLTVGRRYYLSGNCEIDQHDNQYKRYYLYVGGTPYDAPAVVLVEDTTATVYQIYRDHLGSIVMYAAANDSTRHFEYKPWGLRIKKNNQLTNQYVPDTSPTKFIRFFTGHEEIPYTYLLNTNARLYDPVLCRFFSPDPVMTIKGNPTDFNPYIYGHNNPLTYTDPDGEFAIAAAILIGAGIGGVLNTIDNWDDIHNAGDFFLYFGMGAGAGAASMAIGSISFGIGGIIGGALSGMAGGAVSGFMLGAGNAAISGGDIWKSCLSSTWKGALFGAILGGAMGGYDAWTNGKNIWTGADKINTSALLDDIDRIPLRYEENSTSIGSVEGESSIRPEVYIDEKDPYYQKLLKEAQERYPNKAGHMQLHHIDPKYMGGNPNGPLINLDGAYHQLITNEFRKFYPYGIGPLNITERELIMRQVYMKYPLPIK